MVSSIVRVSITEGVGMRNYWNKLDKCEGLLLLSRAYPQVPCKSRRCKSQILIPSEQAFKPIGPASTQQGQVPSSSGIPCVQGNAHGQSVRRKAAPDAFTRGESSPASAPGSPLTYGPQVAMEPIARNADNSVSSTDFSSVSGWGAAQPKLVPTVIACTS